MKTVYCRSVFVWFCVLGGCFVITQTVDAQTIIKQAAIQSAVINQTKTDDCTGTTSPASTAIGIGNNCTAAGLTSAYYAGTNTINGITYNYIAMPSNCSTGIPAVPITTFFTPTCTGGTDSFKLTWGMGTDYNSILTPTSLSFLTDINDGRTTSQAIIASLTGQSSSNYAQAITYCGYMDYGGYRDWFLPSANEGLTILYPLYLSSSKGNLINSYYYALSEYSPTRAMSINASNGQQFASYKNVSSFYVRCLRRY